MDKGDDMDKQLMTRKRHYTYAHRAQESRAEGNMTAALAAAKAWASEILDAMGAGKYAYEGPTLEGLLIHWPEQALELAMGGI